jgi:hypothetical protein
MSITLSSFLEVSYSSEITSRGIDIDLKAFANAFQKIFNEGAGGLKLRISDLRVRIPEDKQHECMTKISGGEEGVEAVFDVDYTTLTPSMLVEWGTPLFDALIFSALKKEEQNLCSITSEVEMITGDIARTLAYVVMYAVFDGKFPKDHNEKDYKYKKISILASQHLEEFGDRILKCICSSGLAAIPTALLNEIDFTKASQTLQDRMKRGTAGRRMLNALLAMEKPSHMKVSLMEGYKHLLGLAALDANKDHTTATRSSSSIDKYQSINAMVGNLMIMVYSNDEIERAVENGFIFQEEGSNVPFKFKKSAVSVTNLTGKARAEKPFFKEGPIEAEDVKIATIGLQWLPPWVAAVTHASAYEFVSSAGDMAVDYKDGQLEQVDEEVRERWCEVQADRQPYARKVAGYGVDDKSQMVSDVDEIGAGDVIIQPTENMLQMTSSQLMRKSRTALEKALTEADSNNLEITDCKANVSVEDGRVDFTECRGHMVTKRMRRVIEHFVALKYTLFLITEAQEDDEGFD